MSARLQLITPSLLKYSYGSVQVAIDPTSTVAELIRSLQLSIEQSDLRAKGKEDELHVTVRYGIQDDKTEDIQSYLKQIKPFSISFGKTKTFPPSKNSDNASVVYVEVTSPELEKINEDLGSVGNFKQKDFDYHPHLTLAYVSPDSAYKYEGLAGVNTFSYTVDSVEICSKDDKDSHQLVQLSKSIIARFGKLCVYIPNPMKG